MPGSVTVNVLVAVELLKGFDCEIVIVFVVVIGKATVPEAVTVEVFVMVLFTLICETVTDFVAAAGQFMLPEMVAVVLDMVSL